MELKIENYFTERITRETGYPKCLKMVRKKEKGGANCISHVMGAITAPVAFSVRTPKAYAVGSLHSPSDSCGFPLVFIAEDPTVFASLDPRGQICRTQAAFTIEITDIQSHYGHPRMEGTVVSSPPKGSCCCAARGY